MVVSPLILCCIALFADPKASLVLIVAAHCLVAGIALLAEIRDGDVTATFVAFYALLLFDLLAADGPIGPLAVGAVWFGFITIPTPILVMDLGRAFLLFLGSVSTMVLGVWWLRPDWGNDVPVALLLGTAGTLVAALTMRLSWDAMASRVDHREEVAARERERAAVWRVTAAELAEDSRVLHDSVVNTLAALAAGGSVVQAGAEVRARCARDARTARALMAGRSVEYRPLDTVAGSGLAVARTGLDDEEFRRLADQLAPKRLRAFLGALDELTRNVVKHARATAVTVDVRRHGNQVRLTVRDDGVGFVPAPVPGRGLAESVISRVEAVDGWVEIDTAPGRGTTVHVEMPLTREPVVRRTPRDPAAMVHKLRDFACWSWAVAICLAGAVLEAGSRPTNFTASWAALGFVAGTCVVAWAATRNRATAPMWVLVLLVTAVPVGFLLGFAGVGYGHDQPHVWHPLGLTPLLLALLVLGRTRLPMVLGMVGMFLAAAGVIAVRQSGWSVGFLCATFLLTHLALMITWSVIHDLIGEIGKRLGSQQQRIEAHRREAAASEAIAAARGRWLDAGISSVIEVLDGVAAGELDPADAQVRRRCDEEERHLRQLVMISASQVHLGGWLAQALATARGAGVRLTFAPGAAIVRDPAAAEQLGSLLVDVVESAPAGSELRVGLFDAGGGVRMSLLGSAGDHVSDKLDQPCRDGLEWRVERLRLGGQELVTVGAGDTATEVTVPAPRRAETGRAVDTAGSVSRAAHRRRAAHPGVRRGSGRPWSGPGGPPRRT
ncbi:ATP-binding protein [Nocardioides sp. AE5]|uniref:sensor histidine kinase n=1 Tax=Nocardioides sp. AE5 TaxID=2962573 RepID=UPI0028810D14|nr:ATP-binding protein [Nocardioides sp. AE5]MDT0203421.1 ATP-binding protein [Nocardioides sp. AE5]